MKIKKGDTVKIMKGRDSGKAGKVIKIFPKSGKILLEGLNLFKKHVRPRRQGEKGEVVQIAKPMNAANVMLVCSNCKRQVRAAFKFENEKKIRYCRKCGSNT